VARAAAAIPIPGSAATQVDCVNRNARRVIAAAMFQGASRETRSRTSPSWRETLPPGALPRRRTRASAYEIAPGVATGSLLSEVVTRVT
jgi:hypothetical protein